MKGSLFPASAARPEKNCAGHWMWTRSNSETRAGNAGGQRYNAENFILENEVMKDRHRLADRLLESSQEMVL